MDRKWTLWTRYLDVRRTLDYNLLRILKTFGQPIALPQLARELESWDRLSTAVGLVVREAE